MNRLSTEERAALIRALWEGNSLRATSRLTGAALNTVTRLLVAVGRACDDYQAEHLVGLPCKRVQCDEIWAYSYAKRTHVAKAKKAPADAGDVWTWVALCQDTKIVPTWYVGQRTPEAAQRFVADLAPRIAPHPQITTDGLPAYVQAVFRAFGKNVDYAQLIKVYEAPSREGEARYSPPVCVGAHSKTIIGAPNELWVSTSYVERSNLSMRMGMRRFTRLTNAFSKKVANLEAAVALYFMNYNYVRVHQTLKTTPALAAGVSDHRWTADEIAALLDQPRYADAFKRQMPGYVSSEVE